MSFFGELRRRNVLRVGIAYLAAIWVLIQVADTVLPVANAPSWILQALVFSSALGFPLAVVLAWFYEVTPEGIKATADVEFVEAVRFTGRKVDFAIIGLLVIAVGFLLFRSPLEEQDSVLPNSIAVLPFDNLSPDPDNAYFATGLHEEILNQLTKLRNLSVISRTSVVRYENSDLSIPEIAKELSVGTIMEGSVRYANDRVRITTQLIDAETDEHLWSQTYDREFSDIFAIESDIAMNVANALEAEFSPEEQQRIEKLPTASSEAYALYLKAISDFLGDITTPGLARNRDQIESLLLAAIDLDQDFSLAHSGLAWLHANAAEEGPTLEHAEKALTLDPDLGSAYTSIALMYWRTARFEEALDFSQQGFQRGPTDPFVLTILGNSLVAAGQAEQGLRVLEQNTDLDPANGAAHRELGWARWYAGDRQSSVLSMRRFVELDPGSFTSQRALGMTEAALGNQAEAVARTRRSEQLSTRPSAVTAYSYRLVGLNDDAARLAGEWATSLGELPPGIPSFYYHLALGEEEQALHDLMRLTEGPVIVGHPFLWAILNAFDDPALEKTEFQVVRAELRDKVGWN